MSRSPSSSVQILLRISSGIRSRGEHDALRAILSIFNVSTTHRWVEAATYVALVAASLTAVKGTLLLVLPAVFSSSLFRLVIVADDGWNKLAGDAYK